MQCSLSQTLAVCATLFAFAAVLSGCGGGGRVESNPKTGSVGSGGVERDPQTSSAGSDGVETDPETSSADGVQALSVTGRKLTTCSQLGTALTGFTRDGHCMDEGDDDAGSHHICIKMKPDFCTVTGQPNWCGDEMQCMGQEGDCPIGNWCVCQWAFAGYIRNAGGCDSIVDIVCDATNMAALKAYRSQADNDPEIKEALQCLEKRCGLEQTVKIV
jgi:uncharacterized protein (DUF2237 family)